MKINVKGSITPPRGTPGANGAYLVDIDVELPEELVSVLTAGKSVSPSARAHIIMGGFVSHEKCICGHFHECVGSRVVNACPTCEACDGFQRRETPTTD